MIARSLGAIIAGGRSERFGSTKALAEVGGEPIVTRVAQALRAADTDVVALTADDAIAKAASAPARPDVVPGLGALGGIHTALLWARDEDRPGILAVACDMPFLSVPLLERILELSRVRAADIVAPESGGPRIVEPLCAWYGARCVGAIESAIQRGDHRLIGFHEDVHVVRVPLSEVRSFGPLDRLFLNVNTPGDQTRADSLAREVNPD